MPATFSRSLRALRADRSRRALVGLAVGALLVAAWGIWLFGARVAVYEVSGEARLEVDQSVHTLAAPVGGRVVAAHLALGRQVAAGEVLVEIDATAQALELEQTRARLAALDPERSALEGEIAAESRRLAEAEAAGRAELSEARARLREGEAAAALADEEAARMARLHQSGGASASEVSRTRAAAQETRAAAEALDHRARRLELEQRERQSGRLAHLEELRRELAQLDGELATTRAAVDRLAHEVEQRRVRAPVAGALGEALDLRVGAVVAAGDALAAIVPAGRLRVVAHYPPSASVGRIAPGQPARLRLDGFPWTRFGTLPAVVTSVASEPRDGRIRVELAVREDHGFGAPLTHGMSGALEIEVERVSPAALVLRAAGERLDEDRE
jgi:membrane fusion protein (multidrug efflux system)